MKKLAILLLFFSFVSNAQQLSKLTEIFRKIVSTNDTIIIFKDLTITNDLPNNGSIRTWLINNTNAIEQKDSTFGKVLIMPEVRFLNCNFIDELKLYDLKFLRGFTISNSRIDNIVIENSIFIEELSLGIIKEKKFEQGVNLRYNNINSLSIILNHGYLDLEDNKVSRVDIEVDILDGGRIWENIFINNENFQDDPQHPRLKDKSLYGQNRKVSNSYFNLGIGNYANWLAIYDNEFICLDTEGIARIWGMGFGINIRGIKSFNFSGNIVRSKFDFLNLDFEDQLIIENNDFENSVGFTTVIFSEFYSIMPWDQFKNDIGYYLDVPGDYFERGEIKSADYFYSGIEEEVSDKHRYSELIKVYKNLHTIYSSNGDLESANSIYSKMKDIQINRLKYKYEYQKSFDNYFRWKLAQLLKIYVNHGTNPARAVTVSMYVILIFGVFYFFFPSEWDITSKGKLIKDFKDFVQKNDKGYMRPFLSMLLGFIISLINALTLSLNAFTTLGFGRIPAKGLAKYVCVIQGFIGWFLLSIFTVSLINQVLA